MLRYAVLVTNLRKPIVAKQGAVVVMGGRDTGYRKGARVQSAIESTRVTAEALAIADYLESCKNNNCLAQRCLCGDCKNRIPTT